MDTKQALRELVGQVEQARDGFGVYRQSPSMDAALAQAHAALSGAATPEPLSIPNDGPCVQDLVIADIEARKQVGIRKYGTVLQPFNGRDALMDLYQELLDAAVYIRQVLEEQRG